MDNTNDNKEQQNKNDKTMPNHSNSGNFANDPQRAREAGRKGGQS